MKVIIHAWGAALAARAGQIENLHFSAFLTHVKVTDIPRLSLLTIFHGACQLAGPATNASVHIDQHDYFFIADIGNLYVLWKLASGVDQFHFFLISRSFPRFNDGASQHPASVPVILRDEFKQPPGARDRKIWVVGIGPGRAKNDILFNLVGDPDRGFHFSSSILQQNPVAALNS
jgi:hypothetical protein